MSEMSEMSEMTPTVALVNNTSGMGPHFGCQLVGQTFREQFARVGLKLRWSLPRTFDDAGLRRLEEVDLVVINGEGSTHHGRHSHLVRLAARFPTVLVNCVFQQNPPMAELADLLYIAARESLSASEIRSHGVECEVVPDVMYASSLLRAYVKPEAKREIGHTDNARRPCRRPLGPFRRSFGFSPCVSFVERYLDQLCRFRRICIGRFHAAVAASVLGIPFSTWDSNTWKTEGLMRDMAVSHLHFPGFEEAMANVPKTFDPRIADFAEQADLRVRQMFDRIAEIARTRCRFESRVCEPS